MNLALVPTPPCQLTVGESWVTARDNLLEQAKTITVVSCKDEADRAARTGADMKRLAKQLDDQRKEFMKPWADAASEFKRATDTACADVMREADRLARVVNDWAIRELERQKEEARQREEDQRKAAEAAVAAHEVAVQAGLESEDETVVLPPTAPAPEPEKVSAGAVRVRTSVVFDVVTDAEVPGFLKTVDSKKVKGYIGMNEADIRKAVETGHGDKVIPGLVFRVETATAMYGGRGSR